MNKQETQRWELYLEIKEYIREYMHLYNWTVVLDWYKNYRETNDVGATITSDYRYLTAKIEFDNEIIFKDDRDFEAVFELLTHEFCHIFTSFWDSYFKNNEDNLRLSFSQKEWALHHESILFMEEQLTNILDKVIMKGIKLTKEYKDFEKRFNKIK